MAIEDDSSPEDTVLDRLLPESVASRLRSDNGADDESLLLEYLPQPAIDVLQAIRGSFVNFIAALGVFFLVLGIIGHFVPAGIPIISNLTGGVMAGLWAIWGISAILYAAIAYGLMIAVGYK